MGSIVSIEQKGDFKRTTKFLNKLSDGKYIENIANIYGKRGVEALSSATPKESGKTAASWYYTVEVQNGRLIISWNNSNLSKNWFPIALYLQLGHGTGKGGWVEGRDYINPAIQPIFDEMSRDIWREVTE